MTSKKLIVYVNSRNKIAGVDNDFSYKIQLPPNNNYTQMCLLQALIPKTYYLIQSGYNTFNVQESAGITEVSIPVGNYTFKALKTVLQTQLNAILGYTYTVSIPAPGTQTDTGKISFTVSDNAGYQPTFIMPNSGNMYEVLGFEKGISYTFNSDALSSVNVCKLQLEDALFIHCDAVDNTSDDILQDVYSYTNDFSSIVFQQFDVANYSKPLRTNKNNVYRFSIRNEEKELIGLNGLNTVLTLMFF